MARKKSLVDQYGGLPPGLTKADVEAVLQFLYGAFDKRMAKQVRIQHPYLEVSDTEAAAPEMTIFDFCRWLSSVA